MCKHDVQFGMFFLGDMTSSSIVKMINYTFFPVEQVSIDEDEWHTNGAGFPHSHKHGFGLLNSWRLVMTSKVIYNSLIVDKPDTLSLYCVLVTEI